MIQSSTSKRVEDRPGVVSSKHDEFYVWGGLFLAGLLAAVLLLPIGPAVIAASALIPVLAVTRADLRHRLIPDIWLAGLACLGLAVAATTTEAALALVRGLIVATCAFALSRAVFGVINGRSVEIDDGLLGTADIAAIGVAGLWLPIVAWLVTILISSLAATLLVLTQQKRHRDGVLTHVPYVAFLAITAYGTALVLASPLGYGLGD
jgi:prepilin signal peptidase PulO-like enzyme (type II secretory pathway)